MYGRLSWPDYAAMSCEVQRAAGDWDALDDIKGQLQTEKVDLEDYIWRLEQAIEEVEEFMRDIEKADADASP